MAKYTYKEFIQAHKGKALDYDGVAGCQCVDLVKYYLDEVFGLKPGAWGDAHSWYDNFENVPTLVKNFTKIPNTPEFVPQKGDIVVWSGALSSGGWGHIAIASGEGDTTWFNSWDCNWTGRHDAAAKIKHNYNAVYGVLRPKNQEPITGKKTETKEETKTSTAPAQDNSVKKVLDISQYQTSINYKTLASEVDGVIIRIGYRGWGTAGTLCKDSMFDTHLSGVKTNKIPYGFYFFSQATTASEAKAEADYAYNLIKSSSPTYPVYIDVEESGAPGNSGRADGLNKTQRTNIINAFCKEMEDKGFKSGVYASESWFGNKFDTTKLGDYSIWVAKYGVNDGVAHTKPNVSSYDGWQFTSVYKLNSINSGIDMSYFYKIPTLSKKETKTETTTSQSAGAATTSTVKTTTTTKTTTTQKKSEYTVGKVYTLQVDLKVRSGAGTSYAWKSRSQLTPDGQANSYNQSKAVLKKGTKVTVLAVKELTNGEIWIQGPSGFMMGKTADGEYYIR